MNKKIKMFVLIIMAVVMVAMLSTVVSATNNVNAADLAGKLHGTSTSASTSITDMGNQIIGIITTVGVVVAVVVLLVLGIKYMMGSASEKAEYKKTMIPYLVGAILIFGASAITKVVVSIGAGIKN